MMVDNMICVAVYEQHYTTGQNKEIMDYLRR